MVKSGPPIHLSFPGGGARKSHARSITSHDAGERQGAMSSAKVTPRRKRSWEAADTVLSLTLFLLIAVFGIFAFLVWQGYGRTLDDARQTATASATIVAEEVRSSLSGRLDLLAYVATTSALPEAVPPEGIRLLGLDAIDSDFLAPLAEGAKWTISTRTHEVPVELAYRIERNGVLAGAAVLSLPEDYLQTLVISLDLGPKSSVSVLRADGKVAIRLPRPEAPLDLGGSDVLKTLSSAASGSYLSPSSPADGVPRIVGFRRLDALGLIAIAAVSQDAVLGQLWHSVQIVLFLMIPIGLALLLGSFLTARLLRESASTQRSLATALEQNQLLFREIHHRVKNNLQSVSALLNLHPIPREMKVELGQRISAMSAVHEHIYRSNNFATVELASYLQTLVTDLRSGLGPGVTVRTDFADLQVDSDAATPLGLIFSEAVSNAIKHAFADGREGVLDLSLRQENGEGILGVRDNGVGYDPQVPARGIGRKLILALSQQIRGEASFSSGDGSLFQLRFPLHRPQ